MWKLSAAIALSTTCLHTQSLRNNPLHLTGTVTTADGKPISGASIDHSDIRLNTTTDSTGNFALPTGAPTLIVRKAGYRSTLLHIRNDAPLHVVLDPAEPPRAFPVCAAKGKFTGMEDPQAAFRFPKTSGIIVDIEGSHSSPGFTPKPRPPNDPAPWHFFLNTKKQGPVGVVQRIETSASAPRPPDDEVWRSATYLEVIYKIGEVTILDARGRSANENRWRYLARPGESAAYYNLIEETAQKFDKFLDGACLNSPARK